MKALRVNTILYCQRWPESVEFYRNVLELPVHWELDWLVEFELGPAAFLSVADATRSSIPTAAGRGLTVSVQVQELEALRLRLEHHGVRVADVPAKPDFVGVFAWDPEGHRLEFWQPR